MRKLSGKTITKCVLLIQLFEVVDLDVDVRIPHGMDRHLVHYIVREIVESDVGVKKVLFFPHQLNGLILSLVY